MEAMWYETVLSSPNFLILQPDIGIKNLSEWKKNIRDNDMWPWFATVCTVIYLWSSVTDASAI